MARVNKQTYADFTLPGFISSESHIVKIKNKDVSKLKVPEAAFSVQFFDIFTTSIANKDKSSIANKDKSIEMQSERENESRLYYIGTKIYTADEVLAETEKEKPELSATAIDNRMSMIEEMKQEGHKFALKVRVGGFIKMSKGTSVLLVNKKKIEMVKIK